jgi:hypothetical protein
VIEMVFSALDARQGAVSDRTEVAPLQREMVFNDLRELIVTSAVFVRSVSLLVAVALVSFPEDSRSSERRLHGFRLL